MTGYPESAFDFDFQSTTLDSLLNYMSGGFTSETTFMCVNFILFINFRDGSTVLSIFSIDFTSSKETEARLPKEKKCCLLESKWKIKYDLLRN